MSLFNKTFLILDSTATQPLLHIFLNLKLPLLWKYFNSFQVLIVTFHITYDKLIYTEQ